MEKWPFSEVVRAVGLAVVKDLDSKSGGDASKARSRNGASARERPYQAPYFPGAMREEGSTLAFMARTRLRNSGAWAPVAIMDWVPTR